MKVRARSQIRLHLAEFSRGVPRALIERTQLARLTSSLRRDDSKVVKLRASNRGDDTLARVIVLQLIPDLEPVAR